MVQAARRASPDELAAMRVNPNPRIVALLDFALGQVAERCIDREKYKDWFYWSDQWRSGQRCPGTCVDVAHKCFAHKDDLIGHTLGQLAWAGKEACYSTKTAGWYVVRYIADAVIAFGIAFPENVLAPLPAPPTAFSNDAERDQVSLKQT